MEQWGMDFIYCGFQRMLHKPLETEIFFSVSGPSLYFCHREVINKYVLKAERMKKWWPESLITAVLCGSISRLHTCL